MYQHTITIVVSGLAKAPESLADALRWEATYQGFTVDGGYPKIETKEVVNPNARITHNRLREYHAKMRSMGINASPGRHVVIRGALGFDVDKASALTNAQFDKVMAALNA